MTVRELVKHLEKLNPDAPVLVRREGVTGYRDAWRATTIRAVPSDVEGFYYRATNRKQNAVDAVILE